MDSSPVFTSKIELVREAAGDPLFLEGLHAVTEDFDNLAPRIGRGHRLVPIEYDGC
jgi:hypothetical protein